MFKEEVKTDAVATNCLGSFWGNSSLGILHEIPTLHVNKQAGYDFREFFVAHPALKALC